MSYTRSYTREKHIEYMKEYNKKYYMLNKEKLKEDVKKYYFNNKKKVRAYRNQWEKNKIKSDPNFKIRFIMKQRVRSALKNNIKSGKTIELLGLSINEFWLYLQSKFKPGMTKENYGKWHLDHIIPCSSFDLSDPKQQAKCFHYSNIQPLWAEENLKKGAKLEWQN